MKILVKKVKFGFMYKQESDQGWRNFTEDVKTKSSMIEYFKQGKHTNIKSQFDPPEIVFTNQKGVPVKHYTINPNEKILGFMVATVDFEKKLVLDTSKVDPNEKITNDILFDLCKKNALLFGLPPEIEFLSD